MASSESELNISSFSKMKVAELKKELKAKGLSTTGSKNELVERLQQAATQGAQDLVSEEDGNAESEILDEDEVLGDEEAEGDFDDDEADAVLADEPKEKTETTPAVKSPAKRPAPLSSEDPEKVQQPKKRILVRPLAILTGKENGETKKNNSTENSETKEDKKDTEGKKIIKLSGISVQQRLELRAQKFGVPLSEAAKKEARAARFGLTSSTPANTGSTAIPLKSSLTKINSVPNAELLKKRAERFGVNVSSLAAKVDALDKLKKRQERFGVTATTNVTQKIAAAPGKVSSLDWEERKKLRAQRFKL